MDHLSSHGPGHHRRRAKMPWRFSFAVPNAPAPACGLRRLFNGLLASINKTLWRDGVDSATSSRKIRHARLRRNGLGERKSGTRTTSRRRPGAVARGGNFRNSRRNGSFNRGHSVTPNWSPGAQLEECDESSAGGRRASRARTRLAGIKEAGGAESISRKNTRAHGESRSCGNSRKLGAIVWSSGVDKQLTSLRRTKRRLQPSDDGLRSVSKIIAYCRETTGRFNVRF